MAYHIANCFLFALYLKCFQVDKYEFFIHFSCCRILFYMGCPVFPFSYRDIFRFLCFLYQSVTGFFMLLIYWSFLNILDNHLS